MTDNNKKRGPGRPRKDPDREKKRNQRTPTPKQLDALKPHEYSPGYSRPAEYTPQVYESMIAAAADAFPDYFFPGMTPEEARSELDDPQTFRALLLYIQRKVFETIPGSWNSNIDYNDTGLLYFLFQQYLLLCSRYKQIPTAANYCFMIGLSENAFYSWKDGKTRNNTANNIFCSDSNNIYSSVNCSDAMNNGINIMTHKELSNTINTICRAALVDQAGKKSSIGSIFLLKAVHGFRDSSPVQLEISQTAPRETAQEIAERYQDATPPALESDDPPDN